MDEKVSRARGLSEYVHELLSHHKMGDADDITVVLTSGQKLVVSLDYEYEENSGFLKFDRYVDAPTASEPEAMEWQADYLINIDQIAFITIEKKEA